MKSLQTDFADLRPAVEAISSAPFYDEKLKQMIGTNDPTKFITEKKIGMYRICLNVFEK